ncbi:transcription initiation factor IIA subunit 2 isoform X1 [Humulus lupulus]|uniref:transcription initiation factor IIA subunit 2 isoform X1 n=1 Tax=Humulus lupulus TaxID=3486 RepID=UPI002B40A022|nr:transcription initiation factor IIA subunit 2 isoform X1 [Humulus lupulus]
MATFELYRRSTIGMCLTETLDEMVQNGTLSPELAIQVLVQFDKSMTEALESQVKSKVTIKGMLLFFQNIEQFNVVSSGGCVEQQSNEVFLTGYATTFLTKYVDKFNFTSRSNVLCFSPLSKLTNA